MSHATRPTVEEMAAHIVSEVQYDMRHGKPVSASCDYTERRIKEMMDDARAAGYAEAKEAVIAMLNGRIKSAMHYSGREVGMLELARNRVVDMKPGDKEALP